MGGGDGVVGIMVVNEFQHLRDPLGVPAGLSAVGGGRGAADVW